MENLESENEDEKSRNKEELLHLRRHNQDLLTQIRKLKHDNKSLQEELDHKEIMTKSVEIEKFLVQKFQTLEKETNTDPIGLPKTSKVEERSNKQYSEEIRVPYCHPNHKSRYDQQQGQEQYKQCSSYQQLNYNIEKERRQNRQLVWKPKMRNPIRTINHQTIPMKVDLGWITSKNMQHITSRIQRL
jgi:hypothetical protein